VHSVLKATRSGNILLGDALNVLKICSEPKLVINFTEHLLVPQPIPTRVWPVILYKIHIIIRIPVAIALVDYFDIIPAPNVAGDIFIHGPCEYTQRIK